MTVGPAVGSPIGVNDGNEVGCEVGWEVGNMDTDGAGVKEGSAVDGFGDGLAVGFDVGCVG